MHYMLIAKGIVVFVFRFVPLFILSHQHFRSSENTISPLKKTESDWQSGSSFIVPRVCFIDQINERTHFRPAGGR